MSDWPVGLSTGCFSQTSILDCLEVIRAGGFCMLEICSFPAHLDYHDQDKVKSTAVRMREMGMEAYSFHAPFSAKIDITALDPEQKEHSLREITLAAEAAAILQCRYFVIHPGPEHAYQPPAEELFRRMKNAAGVLAHVATRCNQLGVHCVLENMLPHLLFGHTSNIMWIMGALEGATVGTCLDTGHAYLSGDIYSVTHKLSGHLQMVHVNDNRGSHDDHLPPGLGKIDWRRLLSQLTSSDFRGGMILELAGNRQASQILHEARNARNHLRNIGRLISFERLRSAADEK